MTKNTASNETLASTVFEATLKEFIKLRNASLIYFL
ncbi:hypothetical protein BH11BAC6_BH11BAC6_03930 [soil metagenome]